MGVGVWMATQEAYEAPSLIVNDTATTEASTSEKPYAMYNNAELMACDNNAKALNGMIRALNDDETNWISSCTTAYEAWEALRIAYEGDDVVKEQQIQAYQTRFEDLRMDEKESFDEFYLKLSIIINQAAGIGHKFG